jgi:hypothetical protein
VKMWNPNNPFLYDILAIDGAEVGEQQVRVGGVPVVAQQYVPPAPPSASTHNIKLPEFWAHAPAMWFARAECRFEMLGVAERAVAVLLRG